MKINTFGRYVLDFILARKTRVNVSFLLFYNRELTIYYHNNKFLYYLTVNFEVVIY